MPRSLEQSDAEAHRREADADPIAVPVYPVSAGVSMVVPESEAPKNEARAEFEFPGVLTMVPECRERVMEFVEKYCHDEGDRIDILVAAQEALANAALHGCKDDPAKKVHCVVTATPREIIIKVSDPGTGFDVSRAEPEKYQVTKLTHGRGIRLMQSLMSEVRFERNGAEVEMRKRLATSD